MSVKPTEAPSLFFTAAVCREFNGLMGRFMARALEAGWDAAEHDLDALELVTLAAASTERERAAVRRFFAVFRAECVTRQ